MRSAAYRFGVSRSGVSKDIYGGDVRGVRCGHRAAGAGAREAYGGGRSSAGGGREGVDECRRASLGGCGRPNRGRAARLQQPPDRGQVQRADGQSTAGKAPQLQSHRPRRPDGARRVCGARSSRPAPPCARALPQEHRRPLSHRFSGLHQQLRVPEERGGPGHRRGHRRRVCKAGPPRQRRRRPCGPPVQVHVRHGAQPGEHVQRGLGRLEAVRHGR